MIRGERRLDPIREILNRVSDYDIYRFYIGDFTIGESFCNPFRKDIHPSMVIREGAIELYHQDFADDRYRGTCFHLVQQKFCCDMATALRQIDKDMALGVFGGAYWARGTKSPVVTWERPKTELHKPPRLSVITRRPTAEELRWFNEFHIDNHVPVPDNIYFPRTIYRNYQKLALAKNDLVICYHYPELGHDYWKIYRPLQHKRMKDTPVYKWKWDSNIPFTHCSFLDFPAAKVAGLIKSRKDRRVVMKATGIDFGVFEGESPAAITDETIQYVREHSERQLIVSDNDDAGKKVSWWMTQEKGFFHCNVPDQYRVAYNWTDFADWARGAKTLDVITQHFKEKGWIS